MKKLLILLLTVIVIEFGVNPNYIVSKDLLVAVTIGNQVIKNSQLNMFASLGMIYLLK